MRYLIAPDKFKGSLTAWAVAKAIGDEILEIEPDAEIDLLPIADGGEGTAALLATQLPASPRSAETFDALGRPIAAEFYLTEGEGLLDMSAASGLWRIAADERDPIHSSTYGTGVLLRQMIGEGINRILIGLGGSATVDGGLGMAAALGYRFWNKVGQLVDPFPARFPEIDRVEAPEVSKLPEVIGLADVQTILLGPHGSMATFGLQKGLTSDQAKTLDRELSRIAEIVKRDLGTDFAASISAGAAGGFGYGILTFLNGRLTSGFDLVAEKLYLQPRIEAADIVITGEGKIDFQSVQGKGPWGVASLAKKAGKRVWGIAGVIEDRDLIVSGFDRLATLVSEDVTPSEAMKNAEEILRQRVKKLMQAVEAD